MEDPPVGRAAAPAECAPGRRVAGHRAADLPRRTCLAGASLAVKYGDAEKDEKGAAELCMYIYIYVG